MASSSLIQVINDATLVVKDNTGTNPTIEITTVPADNSVTQVINSLPSTQVEVKDPSIVLSTEVDAVLVTGGQMNSTVVTDVLPSPVATVVESLPSNAVVVSMGSQGPKGDKGDQGIPGPAISNLFIQNIAPTSPPAQYLWIQTGLGNSAQDMTFWVAP